MEPSSIPGNTPALEYGGLPQRGCLPIQARVGRGIAELMQLEPHWRLLAGQSRQSRFLHTFEWQQAYLHNLERDSNSVYYVSCRHGDRVIAIFPLRRKRRRVGRILLWLWELPSHPHLVLGEPLVAPEALSHDLFRALIRALDQIPGQPWDALHLPNLLGDSLVMRFLQAHSPPWTHLEVTGRSMYFNCSQLEDVVSQMNPGFRRNLQRQERKLARQGQVTQELAREGAQLERAFEDFLGLECSGWKGAQGKASAICLHPHLRGFYEELKARFSATGNCLIPLLRLNGAAIAGQFCLQEGDTLYIHKIAYDEVWHAEGPGHQLLYRLIEYCCQQPGIRQLSLVTGPAWAPGRWNPDSQPIWEAYVFRPSLRGLGGMLMRRFKQHLGQPAQSCWQKFQQQWPGSSPRRTP